jgi:hypothetical protein
MKSWIALCVAIASGCSARSAFDFALTGDINERAGSSARVTGSVNNAGYLALDDDSWALTISLGGFIGSRTLEKKSGELRILDKRNGDTYSTSIGGTCTVFVNPHQSSNGSAVTGTFYCRDLVSSKGKRVNVDGGEFRTLINDSANNPNINPPP